MLRYVHQQAALFKQIEVEDGLKLFAGVLRRARNTVLHHDNSGRNVVLLQLLNDSMFQRLRSRVLSDRGSAQTWTVVENEQAPVILVRQSFPLRITRLASADYNNRKTFVIRLVTELQEKRENQLLTLEINASKLVMSSVIRKTYPLFQLSPPTRRLPLCHHFNCVFSSNKGALCAANLIFHWNRQDSGQIMSSESFPTGETPDVQQTEQNS